MLGARIFVGVVFLVLGASFLASTGLLINEFREDDWLTMLLAHSNLFLFFPVLGVLALFAFYLPSVIFTHLYWVHLPWGKLRFFLGMLALAGIAWGLSIHLDKSPRSLWEVSPRAIAADKGEPAGCASGSCQRASIKDVLNEFRVAAQTRSGLTKFARNCQPDDFLEVPEELRVRRYCFPARAMLEAKPCCDVQHRLSSLVDRLQADPAQRSLSSTWDRVFMPIRIFFVLVVIIIALMLASLRNRVDAHYGPMVPAMERGVIIGAFAMLLWPAMDYGYVTTASVLFGSSSGGPPMRLSIVIAPWVLVLLFYFLRKLGQKAETIGRFSGVVAAAVAVLRYEQINDWATRLFGIGMQNWMLGVIFSLAIAGLIVLVWPWGRKRGKAQTAAA